MSRVYMIPVKDVPTGFLWQPAYLVYMNVFAPSVCIHPYVCLKPNVIRFSNLVNDYLLFTVLN